jgi:SAM-dependent methyltransferase
MGWVSYDSVADTYERVAVPWFTDLAEDLIVAVAPAPGEQILDVGTGTGLALQVAHRVSPSSTIVGVDPSLGMLSKLRLGSVAKRVSAMAPGLPFAPRSFDVVLANLSLSHVPNLAEAVADVFHLLRVGGRFGCTAWAVPEDDRPGCARGEANRILESTQARLGLDGTPPVRAVPWEDVLREPDELRRLLTIAGFDDVELVPHRSTWRLTIEDYTSGWGSQGRYRRHVAGETRWRRYIEEASTALRSAIGDEIEITNLAQVAVDHVSG